jgi:hypothetical protein
MLDKLAERNMYILPPQYDDGLNAALLGNARIESRVLDADMKKQ